MPIVVSNVGTNGDNAGATVVVNVGSTLPIGTLVVALVHERATGTTSLTGTMSDSQSNTYTAAAQSLINNSAAVGAGYLFYSILTRALVSGIDSITYNKSGLLFSNISIISATGISAIDGSVSASSFGSSTTPSVTGGAPSVPGDLIVGGIIVGDNQTVTQDSTNGAYTNPPNQVAIASQGMCYGGTIVYSGTSARTYAPTIGSADSWVAVMAGFKAIPITLPPFGFDSAELAVLRTRMTPYH